jgi:hypothetical protein
MNNNQDNNNLDNNNLDNNNLDNNNLDNNNLDNNNQDNSLYSDLNIYEQQKNIVIKFIYDMSYLIYKKKMFLSNINNDFNLIIGLFDENICDILINIYILKKKNKISEKQFILFKFIFDYIKKLNNIDYVDQGNFLLILIDFYKLNNLCICIDIFLKEYTFKELIDYKTLINKINSIYLELSKNILVFKIFEEVYELYQLNNNDMIREKIIYFAKKISFDLFMFYNSHDIFDIIISCFTHYDKLNLNINIDSNIIDKNKNLLNIFESNKNYFFNEYNKNFKKYVEIYSNDIELYVKFKINKSIHIDKFIKNIAYIDELK